MSRQNPRLWTVASMLDWATEFFDEKKIPDPRLSIEWILADVLDIKRLDLYLQFDRPLSSDELDKIRPLVKRRAEFEPLQYITGTALFFNATIRVNEHVLIPRIETEQLVDLLLEQTAEKKTAPLRLLDLGTGSGCIPIAIKKENPAWHCCGVDISEKALDTARANAELNNADVDFFIGDIENLQGSKKISLPDWDIIISNPPYIHPDEKAEINKQVLNYEPSLALFHDDPLSVYKKIIQFASQKKASLYLECNNKTAHLAEQTAALHFPKTSLHKDLDGNNRFVVAKTP